MKLLSYYKDKDSNEFGLRVLSLKDSEELENQIKLWNPHYLIIGSDYKDKRVIGSQYVDKIIFFDRIEGYSTTQKINQINGQNS